MLPSSRMASTSASRSSSDGSCRYTAWEPHCDPLKRTYHPPSSVSRRSVSSGLSVPVVPLPVDGQSFSSSPPPPQPSSSFSGMPRQKKGRKGAARRSPKMAGGWRESTLPLPHNGRCDLLMGDASQPSRSMLRRGWVSLGWSKHSRWDPWNSAQRSTRRPRRRPRFVKGCLLRDDAVLRSECGLPLTGVEPGCCCCWCCQWW
mmetsp:Transcript_27001/g.67249  ORF Transcript_27001/g.67249 Transcript_27001/m.67249 type:complete len:202 (+) Transcript_27001:612-1217(+)